MSFRCRCLLSRLELLGLVLVVKNREHDLADMIRAFQPELRGGACDEWEVLWITGLILPEASSGQAVSRRPAAMRPLASMLCRRSGRGTVEKTAIGRR